MNTLIMKLGATGDVVRTTPLLSRLPGQVVWVTAAKNVPLLRGLREGLICVSWEDRTKLPDVTYDLVINLEDTLDVAEFVKSVPHRQLFGAYADDQNVLRYTDDSKRWFDLSLISRHGRAEADRLKFLNRHTYQELIFEGLKLSFKGDKYLLPRETQTSLSGDIAISPEAGPVWPMKNWAYYPQLQRELEERGLVVNILPTRKTLLEHLADVRNHRCLVAGDSLPMHFALGSGVRTVTLFTCTSPWEIYDYGILTKIVSPLLGEFFYKRGMDRRATTVISVEEVLGAVLAQVQATAPVAGKALV
jgi:heptosyltransferase-2